MIKVFEADARNFDSNGIKVLHPISCMEYKKKSLNGWYIEAEIDIKYKNVLVKDNLLVAKTKSKIRPQAFRIDKIEEYTSSILITANHVMFDAENYYLEDVRPTELSAGNALNYINKRTDSESPFSFSSDIDTIGTQYIVDKNLLEAMELVEERWNGFYDADNFDISFKKKLGHNNGEVIRQKKNLVSRVISEDWSNVVTKLYPKGPDDLKLPEKFLKSDVQYKIPYTRHESFDFEVTEDMTEKDKITKLRELANDFLESNKYPKVCYELSADLQNVEIGDQVQVIDISLNILTEIQEYQYDLNAKKIVNIVFGNYTKDVKKKFSSIKETLSSVITSLSKQQITIIKQTELINNLNKNGIVQITDNEILILDKLPVEYAKNVWRFGLGGLGFSSNGYEGPFETAITIDGQINAKFITAGQISTERIDGFKELLMLVEGKYDFTKEAKSSDYLILEKAQAGNLLELSIIGELKLTRISSNAKLSNNTKLKDTYLVIESSDKTKKRIKLPILYLNATDSMSDEFNLTTVFNEETKKYEHKAKIIRRVIVDETGNKVPAENEVEEDLGLLNIPLFKGTNKLYMESFSNLNYYAKYSIVNEVTDLFDENYVKHAELSTAIKQTESKIEEYAKLKVDSFVFESYRTQTAKEIENRVVAGKIISTINQSAEAVKINANKINITANDVLNLLANNAINLTSKNITISSTNFSVDKNGYLTSVSGKIGGFDIGKDRITNTTSSCMVYIGNATNNNKDFLFVRTGLEGAYEYPFWVHGDGSLHAVKADIEGKIHAKSGSFGGWTISESEIYSETSDFKVTIANGTNSAKDVIVVFNKKDPNNAYPFYLRADGTFSASKGDFKGTINVNSGTIGGFNITATGLSYGNTAINRNGNVEFKNDNGYFSIGNGGVYFCGSGMQKKLTISDMLGVDGTGDVNASIGIRAFYGNIKIASNEWLNMTGATGAFLNNQQYAGTSSKKTKKNIKKMTEIEKNELYEIFRDLDFYKYDYKKKYGGRKKNFGFLIEDIEGTILEKMLHVYKDKKDKNYKNYNSEDLTRALCILSQMLIEKIEKIESRIS